MNHPPKSQPPDWLFRFAFGASVILILLVLLTGCAGRGSFAEQQDVAEQTRVNLSLNLPLPQPGQNGATVWEQVPVRVEGTIEKHGKSSTVGESASKTGPDYSAIEQAVKVAVKAGLATVIPGSSGIISGLGSALGLGQGAAEGSVFGAATLLAGFAAKKTLDARAERRANEDAIAYGKDVATAVTPEEVKAVQRDHRQRQLLRGTNERIKARL